MVADGTAQNVAWSRDGGDSEADDQSYNLQRYLRHANRSEEIALSLSQQGKGT